MTDSYTYWVFMWAPIAALSGIGVGLSHATGCGGTPTSCRTPPTSPITRRPVPTVTGDDRPVPFSRPRHIFGSAPEGPGGSAVAGRLKLEQLGVAPARRHQGRVGALLQDPPAGQDHDPAPAGAVGWSADRADIIVAGALILEGVQRAFGVESFLFSEFALREGVLLDTYERVRGGAMRHLGDVARWLDAEVADAGCGEILQQRNQKFLVETVVGSRKNVFQVFVVGFDGRRRPR